MIKINTNNSGHFLGSQYIGAALLVKISSNNLSFIVFFVTVHAYHGTVWNFSRFTFSLDCIHD